jgi:hypothetical protein
VGKYDNSVKKKRILFSMVLSAFTFGSQRNDLSKTGQNVINFIYIRELTSDSNADNYLTNHIMPQTFGVSLV